MMTPVQRIGTHLFLIGFVLTNSSSLLLDHGHCGALEQIPKHCCSSAVQINCTNLESFPNLSSLTWTQPRRKIVHWTHPVFLFFVPFPKSHQHTHHPFFLILNEEWNWSNRAYGSTIRGYCFLEHRTHPLPHNLGFFSDFSCLHLYYIRSVVKCQYFF